MGSYSYCCEPALLFFDGAAQTGDMYQAYKAVGESTEIPLTYYANNVGATVSLLQIMGEYECKRIVYSSIGNCLWNPPLSYQYPSQHDFKQIALTARPKS